tara:strand:+ start:2664 stop:3869 length:1206 start_codon:yes stop_codon:yes gene_type:complete
LAVNAGRELLARQPFSPEAIGEVVIGSVMPGPEEANIGRIISLRLGCGKEVPAWTVQRNCAAGLQAIDSALKDIATGRHDLVLAGGTEAMSHAPLLFNQKMVNWLAAWYSAKTFPAKLAMVPKFRPAFLAPVIALLKGLTDPLNGLSMGQTAENLAYRYNITRDEMDEFSVMSHQRLAKAIDEGYLREVTTLYDSRGNFYEHDDGLRRDSSVEKLAKLRPFFDKKFGNVTPGNSSQVTDGAALVLMASADAVKQYDLPVLGKIKDVNWAGVDPAEMGLGPVNAITPMLQRNQLSKNDIDAWEINEAFAAQVIGCLRAWEDKDYCAKNFGMSEAFGSIPLDKLNIDGGAIAIGHPVGASGARIVLRLLHILKRQQAKRGVASLCIGGGQGGAILIENVSEVA